MSSCYKCGRLLPDGHVECDPFCHAFHQAPVPMPCLPVGGPIMVPVIQENYPIDWEKVKTFEDMKELLSSLGMGCYGIRGNPKWEEIKRRFLKV